MKRFFSGMTAACAVSLLLAGAQTVRGQMGGSPAGMNAAMMKLFGDIPGFTAKANVRVANGAGAELLSAPMDFAYADNKLRVKIDLLQMKNKDLPPQTAASMKQMGMADMVSIIRQDKKILYLVYPDLKSVVTMPFPKEDAEAAAKTPKITKTVLGKETIDNHPCNKTKVVITDDKSQTVEAITWNVTDLKDFPVQIQTNEKGNTSIVKFSQIQLGRPDAALFDPPAGFAQYKNPQELMQVIMQKQAGGSTAK